MVCDLPIEVSNITHFPKSRRFISKGGVRRSPGPLTIPEQHPLRIARCAGQVIHDPAERYMNSN
jgi:hypothetical protein